jgi:arylsulfatase
MPKTVNGIEQKPLAGRSFLPSFTDPDYQGRSEQYFEIFSNRSIYRDGWKANAQHTLPWRQDLAPGNWEKDRWEIYNLNEDFSEANDLAEKNPEVLAELKREFDKAAERYHVYPFDDRGAGRLAIPKPPVPGAVEGSKLFTYYAGATSIAESAAPPMKNNSWKLTANLRTEGTKTEGVIMGFGGVAAGIVLYLEDGVPIFDYNYFEKHTVLKGKKALPAGEATVTVEFDYAGGGPGKGAKIGLKVNGEQVAEGAMAATVEDTGQPVTFDYKPPFPFTGAIDRVQIEVR